MTRTLRLQLVALLVLGLAATSFIGARYAHVGRLLGHGGYTVTVHLADSGGIFSGADATYRGVSIGRVRTMVLTSDGVDAEVEVERGVEIPTDTLAVVADKSAVGEQYLDFQPGRDGGPFLRDGSDIAQSSTRIPVRTDTLLTNLDGLVSSVDTDDLGTVIDQLGIAFAGTGPALRSLIATSGSFISTAQEKFDVTAQLIKDSTSVLQTQIDHGDDISAFVTHLDQLSRTLRTSDADLRTVIDDGAGAADQLRSLIAENSDELGRLIDQLVTTNRVVRAHLPGIQGVLVLAPYGLESAYSILAKDPKTGHYSARFSLSLQSTPGVCTTGVPVREPFDTSAPSSAGARAKVGGCTTTKARTKARTNARTRGEAPAMPNRVVGTYDAATKRVVASAASTSADVDASELGSESWTWMVLGPAATK